MDDTTGRPLAVVAGASSGIGRELAARFAEHGHDVVMAGRGRAHPDRGRVAGRIRVRAFPVQADLATFAGVEEVCQQVKDIGRIPDAVAVNAGAGMAGDFARDNDLTDELRLIGLNITAAVHLARRLLQPMIAAGRGGVLFTSSIAPGPYHAIYAASNAFLLSFATA